MPTVDIHVDEFELSKPNMDQLVRNSQQLILCCSTISYVLLVMCVRWTVS